MNRFTAIIMLCIVFSFSAKSLQAQSNLTNDCVIISTAGVASTTPYTEALDAANWETYRIQNQRVELVFDNGFSIQLKSAVELLNLGYPLNLNNYRTENPVGYVAPTLKLLPGNVIGMEINSNTSKYR